MEPLGKVLLRFLSGFVEVYFGFPMGLAGYVRFLIVSQGIRVLLRFLKVLS